jgi:CspA family cold shock protein
MGPLGLGEVVPRAARYDPLAVVYTVGLPPYSYLMSANASISTYSARTTRPEVHMAAVNGTIKRLVRDKGFGFVADQNGMEYFFHQSACPSFDTLREGQVVTFDTGQGPKGPRAENVRPS